MSADYSLISDTSSDSTHPFCVKGGSVFDDLPTNITETDGSEFLPDKEILDGENNEPSDLYSKYRIQVEHLPEQRDGKAHGNYQIDDRYAMNGNSEK